MTSSVSKLRDKVNESREFESPKISALSRRCNDIIKMTKDAETKIESEERKKDDASANSSMSRMGFGGKKSRKCLCKKRRRTCKKRRRAK